MNLNKPQLGTLFNKQIRFKIPVYQRHYVWNEQDQWRPLWEDFLNKLNERLNKKTLHPHYTGSIVLFQENTSTSTVSTYNVIDGQQRLTTFQLFIAAFREICRLHLGDQSLINQLDKYLFNEESYGDTDYENQKFKLEPTKFNNEVYKGIVSNDYEAVYDLYILPILSEFGFGKKTYRHEATRRSRILAAYLFFYDQLNEHIKSYEGDLKDIIKECLLVLQKDFQFVEIGLDRSDDPQMIFETMNGRGASLTETDLIRNYIFMRADGNQVSLDRIYENYWDEFDDPQTQYKWHDKISRGRYFETKLQFFIRDYLTLKLQAETRYDQVFYHYKDFVINEASFLSIEEELKELNRYSKIYKRITNPEGKTAFSRLAKRVVDMDVSTIYPLLLFIEGDADIISIDKESIYKSLDSYLTRRFLCGNTNKNYNKVFIEYIKTLSTNKSADDFIALLKTKTAETNLWPTDYMLRESLKTRALYKEEKNKTKSISNILLEVERFIRGKKQEKIEFQNHGLTIEHVLPQTWYEHWPMNGSLISEEDFKIAIHAVMTEEDNEGKYHKIQARNKMLHSIGNLTLLTSSLNPSVSNSAFILKKKELASQSTLMLNTYFQKLDNWDEEHILKRTEKLTDSIIKIWSY